MLLFTSESCILAADNTNLFDVKDYIEKGLKNYNNHNYKEAINNFQQAYLLDSKNALLLYYVAKSYARIKNLKSALYYYKKAVSQDKMLFAAWYNAGNIYASQQRYKKALSYFREALKADKKHFFVYYNIANICYKQKNYKEAIDNYLKSINLNPDFPDSYYNLASIYKLTNKKPLALKYYNEYLLLVPGDNKVKELIKTLKVSSER